MKNGHDIVPGFADVVMPPTLERFKRGDVRRSDKQIQDFRGEIGDPFVTISALARMHNAGRISSEMARAGNKFHADFIHAHLGAHARAADLLRAPIGTTASYTDGSAEAYATREKVWNALWACGGPFSPCGSCAWYVLGLEEAVKDWCKFRYTSIRIPEGRAAGVLIATLGCLEGHYANGKRA
jgi:hypothetical protein